MSERSETQRRRLGARRCSWAVKIAIDLIVACLGAICRERGPVGVECQRRWLLRLFLRGTCIRRAVASHKRKAALSSLWGWARIGVGRQRQRGAIGPPPVPTTPFRTQARTLGDALRTICCRKAASALVRKGPTRCPICIRRWCASKHNLPLALPKIAVR